MSRKIKSRYLLGILGLAVAILLPLFFYLLAIGLHKDRLDMPRYYVVDKVDTVKSGELFRYDTTFHRLNDFIGENQLGETISLNNTLKGKVLVINFFFTRCNTICPRLSHSMAALQKAFRKDPKKAQSMDKDVQFISISTDPTADSIPAIRAYSDAYHANHDRWYFLRSSAAEVFRFASKDLGLAASSHLEGIDAFQHTEKIIIIDKDRYIRGYFDGLDSAAVGKAAYAISLITLEKKKDK
jgi:protein SCO1/2